ncbi:unnamed protein product [Coregonus sp. 'balchen']|nr:unnamed protein product [Coregonus sp. 'balchen']
MALDFSIYFVLDPDMGQLQYFVNQHSKNQKPRGSLPLIGASVAPSDELPHMFTVHSATGEAYKLRASDAGEQQLWMSQLQLCARRHSDSSAKRKPLYPGVGGVVTITHHRSPAAARRARTQYNYHHHQNNQNYHPAPGRLSQVKEEGDRGTGEGCEERRRREEEERAVERGGGEEEERGRAEGCGERRRRGMWREEEEEEE